MALRDCHVPSTVDFSYFRQRQIGKYLAAVGKAGTQATLKIYMEGSFYAKRKGQAKVKFFFDVCR